MSLQKCGLVVDDYAAGKVAFDSSEISMQLG